MKIYQNMTRELVERWFSGTAWVLSQEHGDFTGKPVGFHYHDVKEWLQVTKGKVTFVSAGGMKYPLDVGDVLQIPRGEIHDVEISPDGVDYQMWVPVAVPEEKWETKLTDEDMDLIRTNLAIPEHEDDGDAPFFDAMLSDRLTFYGADGTVLDKKGFFGRGFVRRGRSTSGSVRVLNRTPGSLLLSTVVTVAGVGGPPQSFTNVRLFVQEESGLKCRVWANYPEPGGGVVI
jgi:hypothetical protein